MVAKVAGSLRHGAMVFANGTPEHVVMPLSGPRRKRKGQKRKKRPMQGKPVLPGPHNLRKDVASRLQEKSAPALPDSKNSWEAGSQQIPAFFITGI